ncbi:CST complex subunit STN1 isoform X4 [Phyllostomus discolor]|uniref:CST complex subunit STN1 n=1 Tax=Phyllostomus discolor TaxID=89673 RepID=A0A7E6DW77_9CHIR|nr:CST complex subunit STN1 isoform X4 [Phyllostomus discolor]
MQSESSGCEEETPSLWWGLDPVFLAFAKLYIRDILDLKESHQVPVDDSTGVINCICWKKLNNTESPSAAPRARELSLTSQLKKLQESIEQRTKIEIGDVVRVRGYIRTFREEREIHAASYCKVDDPVCNTQIARMLELPSVYRKVYDQPFRSQALEKEELRKNPGALDLANLTCLLSEKAKEFLMKNRVQTFYQQELEMVESLLSLANQPVIRSTCSEQADFKNDTASKAIHSIFKSAIRLLQEKGFIYQKDGGFDNLFYVTREDKELHRKIHRIIREDCQKPNHMEKGCHFRHILACARLSVSPGLSEPVLQQVLEFLEDQSDIISTMEQYYIAF